LKMVANKFTRMIGVNILLDTNIIAALLKGESSIANHIDESDDVYIPVIVIGELYYGAEYSTQVSKNTANVVELSEAYDLLSVDVDTAHYYGTIKAKLRKQGTPIPENDIWIAAIAIQHQLTLITRDKHFDNIEDLTLEYW
jgi:tRNA(fMet)-specific endonuclease VapC